MTELECNGDIIVYLLGRCYSDFFNELKNAKKASDYIEAPRNLLEKLKLVKRLIEASRFSSKGLYEITSYFGMMMIDFTRRYRANGFEEVYALTDQMGKDLEQRKY